MSEVTDLVMPVLQKVQTELTRLNGKADNIAEEQLRHGERLESIERYMIFHMGLTTQQKSLYRDPPGRDGGRKEALSRTGDASMNSGEC